MAISRRAFGLGLLGLSVAGTGGYFALKDRPELQGILGKRTTLFGFIGGEKQAFVEDPEVARKLADYGLVLDARVAGSVEMVREQALLGQSPQFLWPSSSVMVDLARQSGVKVRNDQVVLNSPIVVYSWQPVADGLAKAGLVTQASDNTYQLDLKALLDAIVSGKDWASVGVPQLFGQVRIVSTDPNRSNSGFMFAGLVLNLFAGHVATMDDLDKVGSQAAAIFASMGLKSSSSGKLFDSYLAGGIGADPLVVGYENQLVEWIIADPGRWQKITGSTASKPVILYPKPTAYSAHPLITIDPLADRLLEVLLMPDLQNLAWTKHGFRGPLGALAGEATGPIAGLLPAEIDAVLPIPAADVMLELIKRLSI
jgi:Bacterial extracellular solute-binding protein